MTYPIEKIRADFPILNEKIRNKPLVYLDNAASCQKPQAVIDSMVKLYSHDYANVHRGVHTLSVRSTDLFEAAREKVKTFINARSEKEIIFVRGATDAINLIAQTYGKANIHAGDEIIITAMEHHSNIVPWQMLCEEKGAILKVAPMTSLGELLMPEFEALLNSKTKLVSVVHMSNALGTINPVEKIIELAHAKNIPVLLDGAQAIPHTPLDVQALDCDFYVFSGHKMCGPTGIGILYGKADILERMQPFKGGGDMILSVTFEKTIYNTIPQKFEAGTPPIAAAIGFGAAVDYLSAISLEAIAAHEHALLSYATEQIRLLPGVHIVGNAALKAAVLSFVVEGVHPHDIGTLLNQQGVAVRTGHHCAQPVMQRFKIPATSRASFAFYNTMDEVDTLIEAISSAQKVFS